VKWISIEEPIFPEVDVESCELLDDTLCPRTLSPVLNLIMLEEAAVACSASRRNIMCRSPYESEYVSLLSQSRCVARPFASQSARVADNSSVWGPKLHAWVALTWQSRPPRHELHPRSRQALLFKRGLFCSIRRHKDCIKATKDILPCCG
jgi:hypothetical protein